MTDEEKLVVLEALVTAHHEQLGVLTRMVNTLSKQQEKLHRMLEPAVEHVGVKKDEALGTRF
jgi:hypothetical protein